MSNVFIKSFGIFIKNPYTSLLLVTYFLVAASLFPCFVYSVGRPSFYLLVILLFLLTTAFFAGWFGTIKGIVEYKETDNEEENIKNKYLILKEGFFSSIPRYMPSLIFYIILFGVFSFGLSSLADYLMGHPDEVLNKFILISGNPDLVANFFATLPDDVKIQIAKKNIFLYSGFLIYFLLTFFSIPALFFNKTPNPLSGLKSGLAAIVKKPFFSVFLFLLLLFIHVIIIFIEAISLYTGRLFVFLAMALRICFIVWAVVLIFSVYEEKFKTNCNNGCNSVGEDGTCD